MKLKLPECKILLSSEPIQFQSHIDFIAIKL